MRWIFLALLLILLFGALVIISNENLHLRKQAEFARFYTLYYEWLSGTFSHAKGITASVVKLDWLPDTSPENKNTTASEIIHKP